MKGRRDLEKGGVKASILMEDCSHAVPAVPLSKAEDAREIEPDDHGLVLPCAPSDEKKVRGEYVNRRQTHRHRHLYLPIFSFDFHPNIWSLPGFSDLQHQKVTVYAPFLRTPRRLYS